MGGWPEHPATCPECGGEGFVASVLPTPVVPELLGQAQTTRCRCDLCHGLGQIEQREADAWAREQDPDRGEDPAQIEASNRFHQWGY